MEARAAASWTLVNSTKGQSEEAAVPPQPTLQALREAAERSFGFQGSNDLTFTDFNLDIQNDADLSKIPSGSKIWILNSRQALQPAKERVVFPPHPKTLTHAGDYEYFAAQGQAPLPFALAELIDNSLRATMRGQETGRQITVSFVLNSAQHPSRGLIGVSDNGCGMTKQELNEWAIMNLSMEDRDQRTAAQTASQPKFLSGNLSYFGVGSKNAAFYLGRRIKVSTRHRGSQYVHELSIGASDLEQRYQEGMAVYEEDLVHRAAGDACTLHPFEQSFPAAEDWVRQEIGQDSFSRVVIGELKPDTLALISSTAGRQQLCRSLAHLYHYYIHGEEGNQGQTARSPHAPNITLECSTGRSQIWSADLADVEDDLESLYLQAKQSEFRFRLDIAQKGHVEGVLWYFPFQDERESLPQQEAQLQAASHYALTQQRPDTQLQPPTQAALPGEEDDGEAPLWQRLRPPLFEAFWQGRLIPGARIDSLPFVEAVRQRRGAAVKDVIPDDCFSRLRGALFFGPDFLVTRNKLTFRDNLPELLSLAHRGSRAQDKLFREWITKCHADLDRVVHFERPSTEDVQAQAAEQAGQGVTAFDRIVNGTRIVQRGDTVRLAVRPSLVGRVDYFLVQEAGKKPGVFSNGQVAVQPLPVEVYGGAARRTLPLRRIEAVLSQEEVAAQLEKELLKVPKELVLETALPESLGAGSDLPATEVAILTPSGQRTVRGSLGGHKCQYRVTQHLWWCPAEASQERNAAREAEEGAAVPVKTRKQKKGAAKPTAERRQEGPSPNAVLVSRAESSKPEGDTFKFPGVSSQLERAGRYVVQHTMAPELPVSGALSATTELMVTPSSAVEFSVQGEGRVAMATTDLMLGEWLPDINLVFKDEFGNVTMSGVQLEQDKPSVVVLRPSQASQGSSRVEDLEVQFSVNATDDHRCLVLSSLQIFGPSNYDPAAGALSIFRAATQGGSDAEQTGNDQKEEATLETLMREVRLQFSWPGLQEEVVPLRLLPGLPRHLSLVPGHIFTEEAARGHAGHATVPSNAPLPEFQVAAADAWGNPTAPFAEMSFALVVEGGALEPASASFSFSPVARIEGLRTARAGGAAAGAPLVCRLVFPDVAEADVQEVFGAQQLPALTLGLSLQPSRAPAALRLHRGGEAARLEGGAAVVDGAEAGSCLRGLAFVCLDEAGQVVDTGSPGKVQISWSRGTKKVHLKGEQIGLPDIQVQQTVQPQPSYQVRFTAAGGVSLELTLLVNVVPAAPFSWSAEAITGGEESQGIDEKGAVTSGQFFRLEVAVLDEFGNRCKGAAGRRGRKPVVVPEAARGDDSLEAEPAEWEQGWQTKEGGAEVYGIRLRLRGSPGPVHLHVRDADGGKGRAPLQPDRLTCTLRAGPASRIMFDAPPGLQLGTTATLPELRVKLLDDHDNPASNDVEVVLQPTAVAPCGSGQAASVTADAGNKVRTAQGIGVFKHVRLHAEQPGTYVLKATPVSREVAGEACLNVQLEAGNAVTGLSVALPPGLAEQQHVVAGSSALVGVALATEDGQPLPHETACEGLAVRLDTPAGESRPLEPDSTPGPRPELPAATVVYSTSELQLEGEYMLGAAFTECRPELRQSKKQKPVRAEPVRLSVFPGPFSALVLASQTPPEQLTVTNAAGSEGRLLLRAAALQLKDDYGNNVKQPGVLVHVALELSAGEGGQEAPQLDLAEPRRQRTDEAGRAAFGDIYIAEGSALSSDAELELRFLAEGPSGRVARWSCSVLCSDDLARHSELQGLSKRQEELLAAREGCRSKLAEAEGAPAAASGRYQRARKAAQACGRQVAGAPGTVADAEAALREAERQRSGAAAAPLEAQYGAPNQALTKSLTRCLQAGQEGVVGVFAQLATVPHAALGQILAAHFRQLLVVLVVESTECRERIQALADEKRLAMPDVLCLTHSLGYSGKPGGAVAPGWSGAGEVAHRLQREACSSSDPPLGMPLPHSKALRARRGERGGPELGEGDWPQGCLGYACNLVRPVMKGHRAKLLFPMLGQTLVFETLRHAEAYRRFCTQDLRQSVPDILTLDFKRINAKGITSGSSFRVPPLSEACVRFGSSPCDEYLQHDTDAAKLEKLLEALRDRDEAKLELDAAQEERDAIARDIEAELEDIEQQLEGLQTRFGSQHPGAARGKGQGRKRGQEPEQENEAPQNIQENEGTVVRRGGRLKKQRA